MKKLILFLVLIGSLFLTGCNKDAEVSAFMKDYEKMTSEISENFDKGDIDGAKKIFDTEKKDLKREWQKINNIWSFQASDGIKKRMNEEPMENMKSVVESANKAIEKYPTHAKKIQAIVNDLSTLLK